MPRDDAYRIVQRATPSRPGTRARTCASCWPPSRRPELDLDAIFDYGHYVRYAQEIVGRLDEIA